MKGQYVKNLINQAKAVFDRATGRPRREVGSVAQSKTQSDIDARKDRSHRQDVERPPE